MRDIVNRQSRGQRGAAPGSRARCVAMRREATYCERALRVRLNLPPFFGVKESDFRFHILYQCTIRTNSRSAPVNKHSDETAPNQLERRLLAAILLNDDVAPTRDERYDV